MKTPPVTSSTHLLKALLDFADNKGIDQDALIGKLKIDKEMILNEESRIPISVVNDLWSLISIHIDDPFLGIHFGEAFGNYGEGHFLFTLMKNSATMKEAVETLIRYHSLMTDLVILNLIETGTGAAIELEIIPLDIPVTRHITESVLSLLATIMKNITRNEFQIQCVSFTHEGQGNYKEYRRIFTVEPEFSSLKNRIDFPKSELDRTFPLAHREFKNYLKHYADTLEHNLLQSVNQSDRALFSLKKAILSGGDFSLKAIAKDLSAGERQLQINLKNEGTSYQELLTEVRKEIAFDLLKQKDILLVDIAFTLGFSDQSSFNHAFKKWTGRTPKAFRES